jgi:hypothetical protein
MVDFMSAAVTILAKKREVALAFLELKDEHSPSYPSVCQVAQRAKVGWHYANLVVRELLDNGEYLGNLIDPAIIHH